MKKAFIFDMDGVIIDSEPLHFESDKMTMSDYGIAIQDEELNNYVGVSNPKMWTKLKEKYKLSATIEELLQKQMDYKKFLFNNRKMKAINGINELICALKEKKYLIALASSSSPEFIELILSNLEIKNYFDVIVNGEEIKESKPAPDIFIEAARQLNVTIEGCTVIEDSEHGILAAVRAGMKCIGYINKNSGNQDLSKANYLVDNIEDVLVHL